MTEGQSEQRDVRGQLMFEFDRPPLLLLSPDEIYAKADEQLLCQLFEDSRLEIKSAREHPEQLGEYFSMWANTAPSGGLIIVGVRNDSFVEGLTNLSPKQINRIETTGEHYCPDAKSTVKRVMMHRGNDGIADCVFLFRVHYHQTRVVKTCSGKVFIRRGDEKHELKTPEEIRQLQAEKGEISFEVEPCALRYPRDFNNDALAAFAATVRRKKTWDDNHTVEDVLELMHLGKREGSKFVPNYACALVFSRDPRTICPGCRIRFLRFDGESEGAGEKWNAVKDEFIDGPIPNIIVRTEELLRSQLRTFSRLDKSGKFSTLAEYPEFAWYEAVVNACAHRSYGNGTKNVPVFVKMFDDKLIIESPGPFPPLVTQENIYEFHSPRNPFLMEAMFYLEFVRMAHEGTRRMRQLMLAHELPAPEFTQSEVGHAAVRVTLRNNAKQRKQWVDADVAVLLGAQVAATLTDEERRIVNRCAESGGINVSDALRLVGSDWRTNKKRLDKLVERGVLERRFGSGVERDPKARYHLRFSQPKDPHNH